MIITNKLNLPEAILQAVQNDPYNAGDSDISVTRIINPPQVVELERLHYDQIEEDCSMRLWSLMGQAMHAILERAEDSAMREERLFMKVLGWKVSGQYDRMYLTPQATMQDYKFCSVWEYIYGLKPEREAQLNMLAYIAQHNGFKVKALEVVFLFRDWIQSKAKTDASYPQTQMAIVPVERWSDAKCKAYMEQRVMLHQEARKGNIPDCTKVDRWATDDVFAVMKNGRKSAVKLYPDDEDGAYRHSATDPNFYVVKRAGVNKRCDTYCPASAFCPQYMELIAPPEMGE